MCKDFRVACGISYVVFQLLNVVNTEYQCHCDNISSVVTGYIHFI